MVLRKAIKLVALTVALFVCASNAARAQDERQALGLIVKLKSAQPMPVMQLRATWRNPEQLSKLRLRMSAAAQRRGVSFLVQRPTAFGAQVIHNTQPSAYADAQAQAQRLRQDPDVEWVVVNEIAQAHATPVGGADPRYADQRWMADSSAGAVLNIPAAYDTLSTLVSTRGFGLSPVVVAVVDSGVLQHPDLVGQLLPGYDFVTDTAYSNDGNGLDPDPTDPGDYLEQATINAAPTTYKDCTASNSSWHGTMVTGILGAKRGNSLGMVGLLSPLPNVPVLPVRVAGNCGAAVSDIIEGLLWAAGVSYNQSPAANPNPARVLSLSFGGEGSCACSNKANINEVACLYQNTVDALTSKGAVLVASAGNGSGTSSIGASTASRPANCPGVLAVTALNAGGSKARYANLVTSSGIATMGGDPQVTTNDYIFTTYNLGLRGPDLTTGSPDEDYVNVAGTSFAAPMAAGTLALMWSVNPGLTVQQVLNGLRSSGVRAHVNDTSKFACSSSQTGSCNCGASSAVAAGVCGAGVLDVDRAVQWANAQAAGSYVAPTVGASWFTPNRAITSTSSSSSGGGGGAAGAGELLGLLAALGAVACSRFTGARSTMRFTRRANSR